MSWFQRALPRPLLHAAIRRKAALHLTPVDRFRVFIAHELGHYQDAFTLLHVAYVFQGLESPRGVTMRITPQHVLPESTVFVAYEGDVIVGTMTVTLDSPAGLPLDKDYPDALRALRERGDRMVEFGSLAVVRRCWHDGVTTLLNMAAYWWSYNVLGASRLIMGINPAAREVYAAVFRFEPLGPPQPHAELTAPVQGFTVYIPDVQKHVDRHYLARLRTGLPVNQAFHTLDLPCFDGIPRDVKTLDLARWKLPRQVFRELFIKQSNRLDSLDPEVQRYLEQWRSPFTLTRASSKEHRDG